MARELIQKTIDGKLYEFSQFNTTVSLRVLARLTKIVGEPIAIALGGAKKVDKKSDDLADKDVTGEVFGKAVKALVDRLDENEVVNLVKLLTSEQVLCDNSKIVFDDHFCGDIGHLFKVIVGALEAQYGNFFGGITQQISQMSKDLESVSLPPKGM